MTIRPMCEADLAACLAIYNPYILNTCCSLEEEAVSLPEFSRRMRAVWDIYPCLVACDGDTVVGYAYLSPFNTRSAYRITADLSIYVHPDRRHAHIGEALLSAIEAAAPACGVRNIVSLVTEGNAASEHFHEKNGFVRQGYLPDLAVKFGRSCGLRYYRKTL